MKGNFAELHAWEAYSGAELVSHLWGRGSGPVVCLQVMAEFPLEEMDIPPGIILGRDMCILGQEMKTQEVGLRVG